MGDVFWRGGRRLGATAAARRRAGRDCRGALADAATAAKSISGDAVADIAAGTVSAGQAEAHAAHAAATRGPQRNVGAFDGCLHGKPEDGKLKPYYVCSSAEDNTLVFESRFESGNLRRSIQVYENEYDLIVAPPF